jgi:hypothetical protein
LSLLTFRATDGNIEDQEAADPFFVGMSVPSALRKYGSPSRDMIFLLHAIVLDPPRMRGGTAAIMSGYNPRTRQGMVEHGDLIAYDIQIVPFEGIALLYDGLIVCMQG